MFAALNRIGTKATGPTVRQGAECLSTSGLGSVPCGVTWVKDKATPNERAAMTLLRRQEGAPQAPP